MPATRAVARPSTDMAPGRPPRLGRCLYCLATGVPLSEEHLIPKSLGGTRTLRDAVCEPCRVATGALEQATLARDFVIAKTLLALKRRRARKKGPRRLPALVLDVGAGDAGPTELDAARFPRGFTLPAFAPAGLLAGIVRGRVPERLADIACRLDLGTPRAEATVAERPLADPFAYAWSIAKWAYGLAVAERGLACCDTTAIRALLLGTRDDVFDFVGNGPPATAADRAWLHGATLDERDGWLVVRMSLLASAGMVPYEVVVGRLDPPVTSAEG